MQTLFKELEDIFKNVKITADRAPLGNNGGYSQLLGYNRRNGYKPTVMLQKYPELYEKLQEISKVVCPFRVDNFMINKNFQTKPHYDKLNVGDCFVFSVGEYEGGELVIEDEVYDIHYNPIIFDGKTKLHYNLPIKSGTKWSVVGFNNKKN
jgi:hypothetical protein